MLGSSRPVTTTPARPASASPAAEPSLGQPRLGQSRPGQSRDRVGPDPGRVDHGPGSDLEPLPGHLVGHDRACHPALAEELGHPGVVGQPGAEGMRGPGHLDGQPGVVHLALEVPEAARPSAQAGDGRQDLRAADRPVVADVPARRQQLVPGQPDPVSGPVTQVVGQHVHRYRPDQVRRQPEQGAPLPQRLPHQAELTMFQVPQAPVHQPGGASRGARREVVLLRQGHRQAARRGVQGDPDAGDPAPDDQHVEPVLGHPGEVRGAGLSGERQHQPMVTPGTGGSFITPRLRQSRCRPAGRVPRPGRSGWRPARWPGRRGRSGR